jgi:predicted ATPase
MINKLNLKSFKSFPDKEIKFKSLTLFSGLNNSGKSSIIQALRMYARAAYGKSPLLDGHGSISEIRSYFSAKSQPIEVECSFKDGTNSKLILNNASVDKPNRFPIYTYVSADRLGPQTVLPLRRSVDTFPYIGEKGEYVLDFLEKLSSTLIPEPLVHPKAQGKTLNYVLSGWLNEIAPGVEFDFSTDQKSDIARAEIDGFRPTNVGFGLSYTLPVLVAILGMSVKPPTTGWEEHWGDDWDQKRKQDGTLLIIENPEAHLHPQGQTAMGRLLALAAACGVQL